MILIKAAGFAQFLAAHATLRGAGVAVTASGGNEMRVPDDTDRAVLRAVAATGARVHTDLTEPGPGASGAAETAHDVPDPEVSDEATPDAAAESTAAVPVVLESKPQVDTPPEKADLPPTSRAPRKTTTRRKTAKE